MIRSAEVCLVCCVLLAACGGEEAAVGSPWPVELRAPAFPECYRASERPEENPAEPASEALLQMAAATRQMAEFEVAFRLQAILLMLKPVLESPREVRWSVAKSNPFNGRTAVVHVEGESLARGERWGRLAAAYWVDSPEPDVFPGASAEIDYSPARVIADFGDTTLSYNERVLIAGDLAFGCTAEGAMFDRLPRLVGGEVKTEVRCWNLPNLPAVPQTDPEFRASLALMCAQIYARETLGF